MIPSDLRYDLRDMVERELNKNERVLWVGQPLPAKMARKSLPAVLFGIPWTGFALFWMAGASGFRVPDFDEPFDFFPLFWTPLRTRGNPDAHRPDLGEAGGAQDRLRFD